jgi:hypothetical protein
MKKLCVITLLSLVICCFSCKKTPFSPDGPTDVRIRNLTGSALNGVVMKIKKEEIEFGTTDSTRQVDFTYMNYFGQVKMTYDITAENKPSEDKECHPRFTSLI